MAFLQSEFKFHEFEFEFEFAINIHPATIVNITFCYTRPLTYKLILSILLCSLITWETVEVFPVYDLPTIIIIKGWKRILSYFGFWTTSFFLVILPKLIVFGRNTSQNRFSRLLL